MVPCHSRGILPQIFGIRQANRCHGNLVPDVYYQNIESERITLGGYSKVLRQVSLTIQISLNSAVCGFYMKDGNGMGQNSTLYVKCFND